ncbi:25230_t:CDS:2 [Dentiscutata erythropus]|uniref:25230_t:CDS:1 n=1 Tax=Dentiscutata erythropus TaxID=1348616 RepID=A0A9N9DFQ7_9GLOM|nr:25230_t:CDS:2 [Dentiscutata erythropus]
MENGSPLTISAIFDIYKEVVNLHGRQYSSVLATLIDFYKKAKARYFTKQHFLDIVYKILVLQSSDLELNELIENIFDGLEV